jgi:hypothetical protein
VEMLGASSRRTHSDSLGNPVTTATTTTNEEISTEKIVKNGISKQSNNLDSIVTPQKREFFRNLLIDYFKSAEVHLIKDHQVSFKKKKNLFYFTFI